MKGFRHRDKTRQSLVDSLGGKCQRCGYDRCLRALQFHHVDSSEKHIWSKGKGKAHHDEIVAHPERFLLLCANCHLEEHDAIDRATRNYVVCKACGEKFETEAGRLKQGKEKYCTRRCQDRFRSELADDTLKARFLKHVRKEGNCWIWTAHMIKGTTPTLSARNEKGNFVPRSARRVAYELFKSDGTKPPRFLFTVTCRDLRCVNPDHLTLRRDQEVEQSGFQVRRSMTQDRISDPGY